MKLFHCIVVLGAAVGGCGGKQDTGTEASGGQTASGGLGGAAGGSSGASGCGAGGSLIIDTGCGHERRACDDPLQVVSATECASPQQFSCRSGEGCACNDSAPKAPAECGSTAQYSCVSWSPECGCFCDLSAPNDASSCTHGWQCHSYDPPVGCQCQVAIL